MAAGQSAPAGSSAVRRAHAAMFVFAFLISTSFTVGRAITDAVDPVALTFLRFLLALLIFIVILKVSGAVIRLPRGRALLRYGWLALLLVIYFVAMFEALRWTDALSAGAVFTLAPLMTAVLSRAVLGQRLTVGQGIALLVAGAGALWVMFSGDFERLSRFSLGKGELIFLFGAAAYAAYSPSVRLLHDDQPLITLTFWTLVVGAILLGIYGWQPIIRTDWASVPASVYLGIVHLAIFTTAISFYLIQYASVRLPSAKVMAYTYLIPAFVLAQNIALGAPWPGGSVLAGVGVIAAAMVLLQRAT